MPLSPHARSPQHIEQVGIHNRAIAWKWVSEEIKENVRDGYWLHADCLSAVADIFARTVAVPLLIFLYCTPIMAREWSDNRKLRNERCAQQ